MPIIHRVSSVSKPGTITNFLLILCAMISRIYTVYLRLQTIIMFTQLKFMNYLIFRKIRTKSVYILCDVFTYYVLHIELQRKSCSQNYNSASANVQRAIDGANILAGHALICDHFYTSVQLAQILLEKGATSAGTCIQRRRFFPEVIKTAALWIKRWVKCEQNKYSRSIFHS